MNSWLSSESSLSVATLTAVTRVYPSAKRSFFLLASLGVGSIDVRAAGFESGVGAVAGVGYDRRVGKAVSMTPFINGMMVSTEPSERATYLRDYWGSVEGREGENAKANIVQFGLGITIH